MSVNPDLLAGSAQRPEEGVAGSLRAKFEAGEAASGAARLPGAGAQMATQVEPLLPGAPRALCRPKITGVWRGRSRCRRPRARASRGRNDVGGGEPDGGTPKTWPPCAKQHREGTGQLERESPRAAAAARRGPGRQRRGRRARRRRAGRWRRSC